MRAKINNLYWQQRSKRVVSFAQGINNAAKIALTEEKRNEIFVFAEIRNTLKIKAIVFEIISYTSKHLFVTIYVLSLLINSKCNCFMNYILMWVLKHKICFKNDFCDVAIVRIEHLSKRFPNTHLLLSNGKVTALTKNLKPPASYCNWANHNTTSVV